MHTIIIIILILAILLVIFTLQNAIGVTITVFFWRIENAPLVLLLLCCVFLGYILAFVYFYPRILKLKKDTRAAQKSVKKFEAQQEANDIKAEKSGPEGIELEIDDEENDKGFFRD